MYIQYCVDSNGLCLSCVTSVPFFSLLQQSTGGIADNIMVSSLMNPWVKKDVNVLVICRRSRDNRQDTVR